MQNTVSNEQLLPAIMQGGMIDPVAAWSQATHSPSLADQNAHSCQSNQRKP
jgi:hypothetical protein